MVSAWLSEQSISLGQWQWGQWQWGQWQVDEKSNEITAIPSLLEELDCEGGIISIDAMGCQKRIVEKIVDYLIALKENQGALFQQINAYLQNNKSYVPSYQQINKDHGRKDHGRKDHGRKDHGRGEKRVVYVTKRVDYLDAADDWEKLNSIVLVESTRIENNKESIHKRIYISSLTDDNPERYASLIRQHWAGNIGQ